ncbi:MAG: hypothetical protein DI532_06600 [Azospirillum brasilense]|nr:MAG: hypothetical protein DI532_06600 [Azospirillum brasilense]
MAPPEAPMDGGLPPRDPSGPEPAAPRRRRRRGWWIAGGVVLVLPLLGYATLSVLLDGENLRQRVEGAVTAATGRRFTLSGPVGLKLALVPTVVLEGPRFANAPGGTQPEMFTARRVEAEVALLPLLSQRLEIRHLTVVAPELLLETDAAGQPNWRFHPAAAPAQTPDSHAAPAQGGTPRGSRPAQGYAVELRQVELRDGSAVWHDMRSGRTERLALPRLTLHTEGDGTLRMAGDVGFRGLPLSLDARGGTLSGLLSAQPGIRSGQASASPATERPAQDWPIDASLSGEGIQAQLSGTFSGNTWSGRLRVSADNSARLAILVPALALPPAEDLALDMDLAPEGPRAIRLAAGKVDLPRRESGPDISLGPITVTAPDLDAPLSATGEAQIGDLPLSWKADLPPPRAAQSGRGPWPMQVSVTGEDLALSLGGTLAGPGLEGAALDLSLRTQDLRALGQRARLPLPGLRGLEASTHLAGEAEGWIGLRNLALRSEQAEATGDLRLRPGSVPALDGRIDIARLDLDAIPPALPPAPAAKADAQGSGQGASQDAGGTPPAAPAAPAPPVLPAGGRKVIPDLPVPLDRLAALEADLRLRIGLLRAARLDWRDGEAVVALHGGRLLADPLAIDGPGGRIALRVAAEGATSPPSLDVSARAPSLDLAALIPALGLPGGVSGMLDVETALSARGTTLREMAAGLNGSLGLALADGRVDISLLDAVAGDLRRLLLPNAPRNGSEAVRCLALRLQARDGVAAAQAMLLETDIASVLGSGSVDLRQERLDLRLLPRARLGGIGLAIPVVVDGALAQPRLRADPQGAASAGAAILNELSNRRSDPGGAIGQALGQILGEGDSEAGCAAQLRIARGGREGPVPAPAAPENRQGGVGDLLRGLLRR